MLQNIFIGLAWFYWHINRPFVGAFTEALFGFGEGGLKVNGRVIVRKMTRYMHELQPQVFIRLEFVHVTRHFSDDYATIDLKTAFTESEQRLSKRADKRPIDVPIEPCQSNENVLQH